MASPKPRVWTEAEDNRLREVAGTIAADKLALEFGICRQTVLQRERTIGIGRVKGRPPAPPRETRSIYYLATGYERDEMPLPAGHDVTWKTINLGTSLEGEPWPLEAK